MNSIPEKQNSDDALVLLQAREQTYREARVYQVMQFGATVLAPTAFAITAILTPCTRAWLAGLSLGLLLLDVAVFDRVQISLITRAAKIAEQFDCLVLEMRGNAFVAGKGIDPELVHRAATRYPRSVKAREKILNWYPVAVGRAPPHVARIACQIANLWYDSDLRKTYAAMVTTLPFLLIAAAVLMALATKLSAEAMVLSILAPAAPIVVWSLRERFRHLDTARKQDEVKSYVEELWKRIGDCQPEECERSARLFQDAIYSRRASSPLIFPFVYSLRRSGMENEMNAGADKRLKDAGY
jgi:hypothetical protein